MVRLCFRIKIIFKKHREYYCKIIFRIFISKPHLNFKSLLYFLQLYKPFIAEILNYLYE